MSIGSNQATTVVRLYAPDGHLAGGISIGGQSSTPILTANLAVDSDGTIAISRTYGGGNSGSSVIDFLDSTGRLLKSISTGVYAPAQITFAPDHSVWAFGWEWNAAKSGFELAPTDYLMVRQYSHDGKQVGAWLPRSLFPKGLEPATESWQSHRITVTKDRIGLMAVSGATGTEQEGVELGLDGKLLGRWRLDEFKQVRGGLTEDDHVYMQNGCCRNDVKLFTLDRRASIWKPVNSPMNGFLYGVDGDSLVFSDWAHGPLHLFWFHQ